VFGRTTHSILTEAENVMYRYYKNNLHMNYVDIPL